ncbi:ABC transporter ATP-binding protein [Kribbella sindirgiensis]|uniref:ABC transporter ATP-binding protein n=1 Tax=Kribbella sindirgiensis TaxID=1124744 RepID=A0A4R0I6I4_9ACTN|nr:ABC transporter ATP-binding protein [Kribbella sindirgiensis]TCC21570.1 ABC transporter ATP-binding protein [Kribbella sindirgiensis]
MLELAGVGYRYTRWLFRDVTFSVPAGTVTAVLGPNGSGKTTLLRCAAGLLSPQAGAVRRSTPAAFVPQAHQSTFAYRVVDMVLMGRVRNVPTFATPGRRDHAAARDAMERVGILDLAGTPFSSLSGGQQQLVRIARAVASGTRILVLDEPATGLDLRNQGRLLTLLRELADAQMAVLLTTHQPDHARYLADTVVLLLGPDDVRVGPATRLLQDDTLNELYGIDIGAWPGSAHRTAERPLS